MSVGIFGAFASCMLCVFHVFFIFVFAGGDWPLIYSDTVSFTQATNLYFFAFTLIITLVVLAFYLGSVLENFQQSVRRAFVQLACAVAYNLHPKVMLCFCVCRLKWNKAVI